MLDILRHFGSPIGVVWLGLLGLTGWCLARRRGRIALLPATAFVLLASIGNTPLTAHLLARLEQPYVRDSWASVPSADAVVMLGGTHKPSRQDVFGFDLTDAGDRILTAVELVRQRKAPVLVLGSGGYREGDRTLVGAALVERWLNTWGVPRASILNLGACAHTRDEAARTLALMQERRWQQVILVTSANHLRRAEGVFRKTGVAVIPVGCDFLGHAALEYEARWTLYPRTECFQRLNQCVHEWIGWYYYRLRGWV